MAGLKFLAVNVVGQRVVGELAIEHMNAVLNVSRHTSLWYPAAGRVLVVQPPIHMKIVDNRFHCESGPAMQFRDGFKTFMWRGVAVPEEVIMKRPTIGMVRNTSNMEVRRIIIERMGYEKFLKSCGGNLIQRDRYGTLYNVGPGFGFGLMGSFLMVKVKNSTPEPDGTYKDYVLPVPPHIRTARQGIAWSFGLEEHEYNPKIET
jgi:hypothetical protein